jgi:ribonuclease PH
VAAVSCGIFGENCVLDLDYAEDSAAETDANFILASDGKLIEIQCTAETKPFSRDDLTVMLDLAGGGADELFRLQRQALGLE